MVQLVGEFNTRNIEQAIAFVEGLLEGLQDVAEETGSDIDNLGKGGGATGGFRGIATEIVEFDRGVQGVLDKIFNLRNALIGLGVGAALKTIVDTSIEFERFERVLGLVSDGAGGVADEFQFIREEAERLGQPIQTLADKYAQLATAAEGTALEGEAIRDVFSGLIEVTSVLGSSAADVDGALLGLTQILSRGVVSTEDLRQITDRLPGTLRAAQLAANDFGGELSEMLEDGELISEGFLPLFIERLREAFGTDSTSRVDGLRQTLNRLGNDLFELRNEIGEGGFTEGLTEALESLREVVRSPELGSALATIGDLAGDALVLLANNLDLIVNIVGTLVALKLAAFFISSSEAVAEFIRVSVTSNPFGLLLRAVIALTPVILTLTGTTIPDLVDGFKVAVEFIIRSLSGLAEAVPVALGSIPDVFAEVFFRAVELGATVLQDFVNTIIEFVNSISSIVGIELDPVNLVPDRVRLEFGAVGADIGEAFSRGFEEGFNILPPDEVVAASADATAASATAIEAAILAAADAAEEFGSVASDRFADVVAGIDEATAAQERFREGTELAGFEVGASTDTIAASFTGLGATIDDVFATASDSGSVFVNEFTSGLGDLADTSDITFEGMGGDIEDFRLASEIEFGTLFESATSVLDAFGVSLEEIIGERGVAIIEAFSNTTQEQWNSIVSAGQVLLSFFGIDLGSAITVASDVFAAFSSSNVSSTSSSVGLITSLWSNYGGFFTGLSSDTASVWKATNFTMSADSTSTTGFISGLWTKFSGFFSGIGAGLTQIWDAFTGNSEAQFATFISLAIVGIQNFGGVFQSVIGVLRGAFDAFVSAASAAISGVVSAAGSAAQGIISTVGNAVSTAASLASSALDLVFAQGGVVGPVPGFAAGGVVSGHPLASIMVGFQEGGRIVRRPEAFGLVDGQGKRTIGIRGELGQEAIFPTATAPDGSVGILAQAPRDNTPRVTRQTPEVVVINAPRADERRMAEIEAMVDNLDASVEPRIGAAFEDIFRGVR